MQPEYWFDEAEADRACQFFEAFLRHVKGELASKPLALASWQRDHIIRPLFGWKREDGTRKHRTVYCELPRGNGKSTLASGVALYLLFADGEGGAEIVSAAVSRDQAAICFDAAKQMVQASPALRQRAKILRRSIEVPSTNSVYKVISADAAGAHGYNLHGLIMDELHAQPHRELYDTLHTALGKRRQPVEFLITTAGVYDPNSICWELHDYALKVRSGEITDDTFLPVIYAADEGDDFRDPETWRKANPGFGVSVMEEYLHAEAKKAATIPSYRNTFERLHLNRWTAQVTRWLDPAAWDACRGELPDLVGRTCYAGLDLSSTIDLSAFVMAHLLDDGRVALVPRFFIPEARLNDNRDRVPYALWKEQGHLLVTPGDVVDYDAIRAEIVRLGALYDVREIRFDPWNAQQLATQLSEHDGFHMVQMRQGFVSMNAPSKELERRIVGRQLLHDGHPVLASHIGNAAIKTDPAGNLKPAKDKSTGRIDGVVASIMALSGCMAGTDTTSVYASRGLIAL